MNERLIRLIRIITLIQSKPGILARELADRCETTERTIYRDLDLLSACYIPITNNGHGKGYSYTGNFSLYPLNWSNDEATAFTILPSILEQRKELIPADFFSAYDKVMASHHKEKKVEQEFLDSVIDTIQMGKPAYKQEKNDFLSTVIQAILEQRSIETTYHTQSRNATTERKLNPYCLIPREHRFYLVAFCHESGEVRTFRLSRFQSVIITEESFEKKDFNIQSYLKNTWSIIRGDESIKFKIKFSPKVARYIKEEELFVSPKMTDLKDGSLLFEVTINHDREFLLWLMQYGPDAEILEPVHYRDRLKDTLQEWMRVYSRS